VVRAEVRPHLPADQYPTFVSACGHARTPGRDNAQSDGRCVGRKPQEKWSAQEHAGHLLDLEPLWMARVDDFLTDRDTLAVADLVIARPMKPTIMPRIAEILAGFRTARLRLVEHLGHLNLTFCANEPASASQAAHAARGLFVFCCRAR